MKMRMSDMSTGLECSLNDFGNLLGEIVGSPQVFSEEPYLAHNILIHQHLPGAVRDLDLQADRSRSANGGNFAFLLAAFFERLRHHAQRDQVGQVGRVLIAAAIDLLELDRKSV